MVSFNIKLMRDVLDLLNVDIGYYRRDGYQKFVLLEAVYLDILLEVICTTTSVQ